MVSSQMCLKHLGDQTMMMNTTTVNHMPAKTMALVQQPRCQKIQWRANDSRAQNPLRNPNRLRITQVTLSRRTDDRTVAIDLKLRNGLAADAKNLNVRALVQDDFGIFRMGKASRLKTTVEELTAHRTQSLHLSWQATDGCEPYHLLIIVEDSHGTPLDTLSGKFWL